MQGLRYLSLALFICVFFGCSLHDSSPQGSLQNIDSSTDFGVFSQRVFSLTSNNQTTLLYVNSQVVDLPSDNSPSPKSTHSKSQKIVYYFALFSSLGTPILSKKLENGRFSTTKFLPPNKQYDKVFVKLLEAIKIQALKSIDSRQQSCQNCDKIEFIYKDKKIIEIQEVKEIEYPNE